MSDPFNLQRFVDAQHLVYHQVLTELRNQHKTSHWIWFIFPQIHGLGQSPISQRFAIQSLAEAVAYLAHPLLGPRLLECTQLLLPAPNQTAKPIRQILGSPDDLKFCSSMTLFAQTETAPQIFSQAVNVHFNGKFDDLTLNLLHTPRTSR